MNRVFNRIPWFSELSSGWVLGSAGFVVSWAEGTAPLQLLNHQGNALWKWIEPVELYFRCPLTGKDFFSYDWHIVGELQIEEGIQEMRTVTGEVAVPCPHCQSRHVYRAEELSCPLTRT